MSKELRFRPQPDITAYELAWIFKLTLRFANKENIFKDMPVECRRHLYEITDKLQSKAGNNKD